MLTFACVLTAAAPSVFKVSHVKKLADQVKRHLTIPHRFVCLTDVSAQVTAAGIEAIPFARWPGWWNKIALFDAGRIPPPVAYADLDTEIVGSLDGIMNPSGHGAFTMLQNFNRPDHVGSGLMFWNADLSSIYAKFEAQAGRFIQSYTRWPDKWGDQSAINDLTPVKPDRWQRLFPGKVVSYKRHVMANGGIVPSGAVICCFHGKPRPWTIPPLRLAS